MKKIFARSRLDYPVVVGKHKIPAGRWIVINNKMLLKRLQRLKHVVHIRTEEIPEPNQRPKPTLDDFINDMKTKRKITLN